jgi:hypothetical protein
VFFSLSGCQKKSSDGSSPADIPKDNSEELIKNLRILFNSDVGFALKGNFLGDTTQQVVTGTETMNKKEWGIRFHLIEVKQNKPEMKNETKLLDGSLKDCRVETISLPGTGYDMVYYNSLSYFMGSGGGEVFAYIIDFKRQKTYYAHLVSEQEKPVCLFLSDIDNQEVKKYLTDSFRKDYPGFKFTAKNPVLN